jgi:hypothetical protein
LSIAVGWSTHLLAAPLVALKGLKVTPSQLTFRAEAGRTYKLNGEEGPDKLFFVWLGDERGYRGRQKAGACRQSGVTGGPPPQHLPSGVSSGLLDQGEKTMSRLNLLMATVVFMGFGCATGPCAPPPPRPRPCRPSRPRPTFRWGPTSIPSRTGSAPISG